MGVVMRNRWRNFKKNLEMPWAAYAFALCSAVLLYILLSNLHLAWRALGAFYYYVSPVVVGIAIAYVLDPLVKFWEERVFGQLKHRGAARNLGLVITLLIIILLVAIFLVALIPQLISSIRMFVANLSGYGKQLNDMLEELTKNAASHNIDISKYTTMGNDVIGTITSVLPKSVNGILDKTISYGVDLFNAVISFIIAIYILIDKKRLLSGMNRLYRALTTEKSYRTSNNFFGRVNSIMIQYILCDLLDGLIIGIANAVFMLIAGYPYVPLISVVVGVTNLAPTFGPILGAVIGGAILLLINPLYALVFLIFTLALQTVDGYILKPKLFGGQLGIPSIWILISIIVFSRMFGVVGILLAIPVAAIIDFVYRDEILPKLELHRTRRAAAQAAAQAAAAEKVLTEAGQK